MEVDAVPQRRAPACLVAAGAILFICTGCSAPPPPQSQPAPLGPRATLVQLIELRTGHKYREMSPLIVPGQAAQVVDFFLSLDDFLAANGRLGDWLSDHGAVGLAQTIDQSYVADDLATYAGEDLGIFSRRVELLDALVAGDQATVSFTVANRVPAHHARLRRIDAIWRYDAGQGYSPDLPAAFHDLARALDELRGELEHGRISEAELHGSPDVFLEKVQARLRRGVALLSKAQAAAAGKRE